MSKLARRLAELRESMEQDAGAGIDEIEVPAALLFDDLARQLGLTEAECAEVLGQAGVEYVSSLLNAPVRLNGKH
jgi:hypothetical protein